MPGRIGRLAPCDSCTQTSRSPPTALESPLQPCSDPRLRPQGAGLGCRGPAGLGFCTPRQTFSGRTPSYSSAQIRRRQPAAHTPALPACSDPAPKEGATRWESGDSGASARDSPRTKDSVDLHHRIPLLRTTAAAPRAEKRTWPCPRTPRPWFPFLFKVLLPGGLTPPIIFPVQIGRVGGLRSI